MSHDLVAETYYDPRRKTVRNFESATLAALREERLTIPSEGWLAEVGAGRGMLRRAFGTLSERIVHVDISERMLREPAREPSAMRIRADGRCLPLADESIRLMAAFLFDSFNVPDFYFEACRVLEPGGMLIGTLPHATWGDAFRGAKRVPADKARFPQPGGGWTEVDSFLSPDWEIVRRVEAAGFGRLRLVDCRLKADEADISPHVLLAAEALGMPVYDLPIVQLLVAWR